MAINDGSAGSIGLAGGGTPGDILLDAGTNELEVLVFRVGEGWFGVNVAKVREVIRGETPSDTPHTHDSVMGVINKRGKLIPLVDLALHLQLESSMAGAPITDRRIIVTEFNGMSVGFVVDDVQRIHRVGWDRIRPAPEFDDPSANAESGGVSFSTCTGIIDIDDTLVLMIDFESIADEIRMEDRLHVTRVDNEMGVDRGSVRVVMAEDSGFMREMLGRVFRESGYTQVRILTNGKDAWDEIRRMADAGETPEIIVSDIEMPGVDGLHLTKLIKGDARLAGVPVILFSSLITEENRKKGQQVGADVQIPKPEMEEMVRLVDEHVTKARASQSKAA